MRIRQLAAVLCLSAFCLASCKAGPQGSDTSDSSSTAVSGASDQSGTSDNHSGSKSSASGTTKSTAAVLKNSFSKFTNAIDYTAGRNQTMEAYQNYNTYVSSRFEYADMKYHWAEEGAIRLAQAGVFEKTKNFEPAKPVALKSFLTYLYQAANVKITSDIVGKAKSEGLIKDGEFSKPEQEITRQQMALILSRAVEDKAGLEQYKLLISDFSSIDKDKQASVVKLVGLGIMDANDGLFKPKDKATRADVADALYKMKTPGMRSVVPFDLGSAYQEGKTEYLVKNPMKTNPSGVQFGFWSMYNWQKVTTSSFGKRPIDRVDFHKWVAMEKSKGIYDIGSFGNSVLAHRAGATIITNVDISANLIWNPYFSKSNIPEFYPQDITDKTTRTAAKQFLYTYVQALLNAVGGDVLLSIDYELDWQQNIMGADADSQRRARIWADWYVEACGVARSAAKAMGASDRLKLIVIYNYATDQHKLGKAKNQWMIDVAKASDYIGLDTYAGDKKDSTNPSVTMESIRFFVNNYTEGKPFIVVENGFKVVADGTAKEGYLEGSAEQQNMYFKNLYRDMNLELSAGGFLQNQLRGFLNWCLRDEEEAIYGMLDISGNEKPVAKTVRDGINRIERKRLFNPSIINGSTDVNGMESIPVSVQSGTQYEKLTYIVTNLDNTGSHTLKIKLAERGTGLICVNGTTVIPKVSMMTKTLSFTIDSGLKKGVNYIEIYFGADITPFQQQVSSISFKPTA